MTLTLCNTKHILWQRDKCHFIYIIKITCYYLRLSLRAPLDASVTGGQSQIISTAEHLFFRIPPSLKMLRIQAGEQEKSEKYYTKRMVMVFLPSMINSAFRKNQPN